MKGGWKGGQVSFTINWYKVRKKDEKRAKWKGGQRIILKEYANFTGDHKSV